MSTTPKENIGPGVESAQAYTGSRPAGSKILVRYCPGNTGRSVMLEEDQPDANPLAVYAQNA